MRKKEKVEKVKVPKEPGYWKQSVGDVVKSKVFLGSVIIILALLISFVVLPLVQIKLKEEAPAVQAAVEIPLGTYITADMLHEKMVTPGVAPTDTAPQASLVVGGYAATGIEAGDFITSRKVSTIPPYENSYLYELPAGKSAISVSVSGLAQGLTGKLKQGDIITLFAALNISDVEDNYYALQPGELKYVRVLAVSNSHGTDIDVDNRQMDADNTSDLPATITLLVGERQAAALAGLNHNATLYASLVARATDEALAEAYLAVQEEFILSLEEDDEDDDDSSRSETPIPAADEQEEVPTDELGNEEDAE